MQITAILKQKDFVLISQNFIKFVGISQFRMIIDMMN